MEPKKPKKLLKKSIGFSLAISKTAKKKKSLPDLGMILTALKGWSKLSYHPEHDGDVEKALAYLAQSPAAQLAAEAYAKALSSKMKS